MECVAPTFSSSSRKASYWRWGNSWRCQVWYICSSRPRSPTWPEAHTAGSGRSAGRSRRLAGRCGCSQAFWCSAQLQRSSAPVQVCGAAVGKHAICTSWPLPLHWRRKRSGNLWNSSGMPRCSCSHTKGAEPSCRSRSKQPVLTHLEEGNRELGLLPGSALGCGAWQASRQGPASGAVGAHGFLAARRGGRETAAQLRRPPREERTPGLQLHQRRRAGQAARAAQGSAQAGRAGGSTRSVGRCSPEPSGPACHT